MPLLAPIRLPFHVDKRTKTTSYLSRIVKFYTAPVTIYRTSLNLLILLISLFISVVIISIFVSYTFLSFVLYFLLFGYVLTMSFCVRPTIAETVLLAWESAKMDIHKNHNFFYLILKINQLN